MIHFKDQLEQILEANLDDDQFGIKNICRVLGMSRMELHRKVKKIDTSSTSIFIRNYRLEKSIKEIQNSNKSISQIAFEVGFKDPAYFSRCFKKRYKISPVELRQ